MIDDEALGRIINQLYTNLPAGAPPRKVAKLVSSLDDVDLDEGKDLIDLALEALKSRPDIKMFGDFRRWRHSEIMRTLSNA